ncbi:hypothetical protein ACHAWU_002781 [Discostella pseudostelligera]|uniref:Uncharacterized protein n=1 Tax=Discostella pseudostelligera TaxID=259834 RepID=A0ABD3M1L1_9STRA
MSNDDSLINSLLGNGSTAVDKDPYSQYSHQIAIPLQDASELHSALHAIQTSLVRDCPRLIRACVMPALLRMPLLYVDGNSLQGSSGFVGGGESSSVDAILEQVVHHAIREVVYGDTDTHQSSSSESASSGAPMIKMVEPILLPFRGLELQGDDNSVLYVVGNDVNVKSDKKPKKRIDAYYDEEDEDEVYIVDDWSDAITSTKAKGPSGSEILEKLVYKIQHELESKYGLRTCWPLDEPQGEEIEYDDPMIAAVKQRQRKWRPRVPFVRLPPDFYQSLQYDTDKRNCADDDDDDENAASRIDMGFDGISPLFWYEAWGDEDILSPPGVRMQSVAIYRRMVPSGGESETSFYVPTSSGGSSKPWSGNASSARGDNEMTGNSMELPVGDAKTMARERRENAKAMERLGEVESRAEREWEEGKARWLEEMDDQSLSSDEESLTQFNVGLETGSVSVVGDAAYSTLESESSVDSSPEPIEDTFQPENGRIQSDAAISTQPQPTATKPRRELPNFEDNPVFQRLWKGQSQVTAQGQNTALTLDGTPPTIDEPLPPYPSDAHFVGAWRVVSSPLGTDNAAFADTESKSSDNFIFRVDGQVMGGPILDAQYQHKAAGGGWKMFQAIRKSPSSDDASSTTPPLTQTRLRVRLLVPPEKDRVLIMEGEVTRLVMPGSAEAASSSAQDGWMMSSGGLLDGMLQNIEDVQSRSESKSSEGLLYCSGEAWMEDAEGGTNRRKVGPFALMKLKTVDRKNLIYTVDVSRSPRSDSEDEEVE